MKNSELEANFMKLDLLNEQCTKRNKIVLLLNSTVYEQKDFYNENLKNKIKKLNFQCKKLFEYQITNIKLYQITKNSSSSIHEGSQKSNEPINKPYEQNAKDRRKDIKKKLSRTFKEIIVKFVGNI